jgi:membrane-bound lytic murein transglycosylase D
MRSPIPIVMNADVEKEIRSFQTVERDFFLQAFQRSYFYRPIIVQALKKAGLPEELSWLPLVESGYKIRALSRARALGLWQFIPSTGYKYGLSRDEWIDERMDVEKSTQAAIGYLKDLHDMFGDWLTVLAAYNSGEGRVLRVISGQHLNYLDRFWDLYSRLPNETARYVPRFLATLHIIKDPQKYGMNLYAQSENQSVYAYDVVTTKKSMNLQDIASRIDESEELLSILNAELRYKKTPEKEYSFKVPSGAAGKLSSIMDEIPLAEKPRSTESRHITMIRHKVRAGETLASIASRYNTTEGSIRKYNRALNKKYVKVGRKLMVPVRGSQVAKASKGKSSPEIEDISRYRVKKGDTLSSLARRFDTNISEIKKMNRIKGNTLKVGQVLKYNKKTAVDNGNQKPDSRKGG